VYTPYGPHSPTWPTTISSLSRQVLPFQNAHIPTIFQLFKQLAPLASQHHLSDYSRIKHGDAGMRACDTLIAHSCSLFYYTRFRLFSRVCALMSAHAKILCRARREKDAAREAQTMVAMSRSIALFASRAYSRPCHPWPHCSSAQYTAGSAGRNLSCYGGYLPPSAPPAAHARGGTTTPSHSGQDFRNAPHQVRLLHATITDLARLTCLQHIYDNP
jgi:hypothetical protein